MSMGEHLRVACAKAATWKQWSDLYGSCILALSRSKAELKELDDFYTRSLPALILSRKPSPYITRNELMKVVRWKLSRGKWRPRLLNYASSLDEHEVQRVSKTSFSTLPDLEAAITTLSSLKGVGPATASAVLAVAAPDIAPFMSDEAVIAVLGGTKEYTLRQYLLFAEKLQSKAQELTRSSDLKLTPCDLERALWCSELEKKIPITSVTKQNSNECSDKSCLQRSNKRRKKG